MPDQTANRPRPEDFLELVQKGKRGRLKLYIGFAAGVGKTYRMLEEAHALKKRGVDVVVGFVETHGRKETEALIEGLEVIPRRQIEYRGVTIEEMSLNNILARNPALALVDELAHTNVPGSHNKKRYQDVIELLDAGINVIGAMNVQHLESLNDVVERATGVGVRETVPDSFLKQADQVVNLDLAVEDLQERLRAGKIYAPEKIPWALEHFFTEQNLAHLRELALREVAESVERGSARPVDRRRGPVGRQRRGRRLAQPRDGLPVVGVAARRLDGAQGLAPGGPAQHRLVRRLRRDARRNRPSRSTRRRSATCSPTRTSPASWARRWCACARPIPSRRSWISRARTASATSSSAARSSRAWKQLFGRSVPMRLIREAHGHGRARGRDGRGGRRA